MNDLSVSLVSLPVGGRTCEQFLREIAMNYDGDDCLAWPFKRANRGYGAFMLRTTEGAKNVYAHRFICELTHGAAPSVNHHAAHSCGNGRLGCINPRHLSWKTRSENEADKVQHGTSNRGSRQGHSKLTGDIVRRLRASCGQSQAALARDYGITQQTVSDIQTGKTWGWLL